LVFHTLFGFKWIFFCVWEFQGECSAYVETLLPEYWPAPGVCHKLNTTNATPIWICSFDIHFRLLFFFFFIEFVELTAHLHLNACNTFILYHISRLPAVILSYSCDIYKKKKDRNFKANTFITSKREKENWIRELMLPCRVKQQK
jgi:hypothetical protein